ncbi:actin-like ATPase domain-containing protein [Neoconidiobolus thromboides FSU 785]|nr:actin-like ATPase domain-containing protein [Neoconidiobolus thromboides FSU 785]
MEQSGSVLNFEQEVTALEQEASNLKIKQKPTSQNVKSAIKLIKANIHTLQPSANSLVWSEERIIIDLGSMYIKFGFSIVSKPQLILPVYHERLEEHLGYIEKYLGFYSTRFNELVESLGGEYLFYDKLYFIFSLLFGIQIANAAHRKRLLILENVYLPLQFKRLIATVLLEKFQVASISFLNAQLSALLSSGESEGIVVDVGNLETIIVVVSDGRVLNNYTITSPLAGKRVTEHLKQLLLSYSELYDESGNEVKLESEMLSVKFMEEFKLRYLTISKQLNENKQMNIQSTEYEEYYQSMAKIKNSSILLKYQNQSYKLLVPGWIREFTYDCLFNDNEYPDELSPSTALLQVLKKLPMDLKKLSSKILLCGGITNQVNFNYRFLKQVMESLSHNNRYENIQYLINYIQLLNNNKIFNNAHLPWVGASIATNIRSIQDDILLEHYEQNNNILIPDWINKNLK